MGIADQTNHWVWFNSQISNLYQSLWLQYDLDCQKQTFLPLDICGACQSLQTPLQQADRVNQVRPIKYPEVFSQVYILQEAYDHLIRESMQSGQLETGGVLLGYVDSSANTLVITVATSPGPEAIHQQSFFLRDRLYCQVEIDRHYQNSNGFIDYVGEWYKHPAIDTTLSPTDRHSLVDIAASDNYETNQPVMLVCEMPDYQKPEACKLRLFLHRCGDDNIYEKAITIQ